MVTLQGAPAMKKRDIFEVWHSSSKENRNMCIANFIMQKHNVVDPETTPRGLKMYASSLSAKIAAKWEKSNRNTSRFLAQHEAWLEDVVSLPPKLLDMLPYSSAVKSQDGKKLGRPEKPFEKCTLKVQKRKIKDLVSTKTQQELALATEVSLRSDGKRDAANIVKEIAAASPFKATQIKKARRLFDAQPSKLSPVDALALIVNAHLSTHQYNTLRLQLKAVNSNIYPAYHLVKKAKEQCYPPQDSIKVTDVSAEIQLQALLDLTVQRICLLQEKVFSEMHGSVAGPLRLISKWGCDGSSAQSRYKQKLGDDYTEYSDENLFSVTLVPLRLVDDRTNTVIWQNPRPNSTRFCRLLQFVNKKETKDVIKDETRQMKEQISVSVPTNLTINNSDVECRHELVFTMVDGKVCSSLSQYNSSQKCYICGASPKEMNNITTETTASSNPELYTFGISPLHSWIRALECLLHISYKLDIKKWQARSIEEKSSVAIRKAMIRKRFRTEMGLLVDMPKQSVGNTNDGNTARRFFRNTQQTAAITGLDIGLIYRFRVILEALSCDYEIDSEKFEEYTQDTMKRYLQLYYLPASIHKIFIHSKNIIEASILPLGQLAEEAQESSNKEYRRFREHYSRKTSRQDTNRDVLNRFLISSDPLLSSFHKSLPCKQHTFPRETIMLLKAPEITEADHSDEEEDKDDSDDST